MFWSTSTFLAKNQICSQTLRGSSLDQLYLHCENFNNRIASSSHRILFRAIFLLWRISQPYHFLKTEPRLEIAFLGLLVPYQQFDIGR